MDESLYYAAAKRAHEKSHAAFEAYLAACAAKEAALIERKDERDAIAHIAWTDCTESKRRMDAFNASLPDVGGPYREWIAANAGIGDARAALYSARRIAQGLPPKPGEHFCGPNYPCLCVSQDRHAEMCHTRVEVAR